MESILSPPSFSPDFLLGKTRLLRCLRNRGTLSNALCSLSDDPPRASIPLPPLFSTRFVSMGVRQTPVSNSVIYLAYVCQRNPRLLFLSLWKTLELMPPNLLLSYFSSIEKRGMKLISRHYFVTQFLHGSAGSYRVIEAGHGTLDNRLLIWDELFPWKWGWIVYIFRIFIDDLSIWHFYWIYYWIFVWWKYIQIIEK